MKFTEKYELLQTLTTGVVETFVANDKVRGEQVLVHIVECPAQKPDQTTAEWVLEAFRRQAPEPPGSVLETGKYTSPKYGYVVMKATDETAVRKWVRRYEVQVDETRETKAQALKTEISAAAEPPAAPIIAKQSEQPPASMTQLFRDFDSLAKSKASESAPSDFSIPKPAPSILAGESGVHAATPWDAATARFPSESNEAPVPAPPVALKPVAPEPVTFTGKQSSKPGEFTSFFQGPFQGDKPADVPGFSSQPVEPPKKNVGEFTALFGHSNTPGPTPPVSGNVSEPSFTGMFRDMGTSQPVFNAPPPVHGGVIPPPSQPLATTPPVNAPSLPDPVFIAPTPVVTPAPPAPSNPPFPSFPVERPAAGRSTSLPGDGATGAFMRPAAEPAPAPVEAPAGPSPYTQIISRPKYVEPEDEAPASPASGGGQFAAPPLPKIPGAAPPPKPKMPPVPKLAPPPVPKIKPPAAPKLPKVDAPSPPPVSMWPLIVTLTVLFFLAVILVLYFVLRR